MMKMKRMLILSLLLAILVLSACGETVGNGPTPDEGAETPESIPSLQTEGEGPSMEPEGIDLIMTIGNDVFPVKLYENQTTKALVELMPMTIEMSELNGNEKLYYLPGKLPTNPEQPGQIRAGEIMLYGDDCLVVFYETFSSPYRYTRLGYVEDASGLVQAVGDGAVMFILELAESE